jgi:putative oligomerization/nucleic acid binding protein
VSSSKAPEASGTGRDHRVLVPVLVVLGAVCLLVSTVSVWIRDIALDPDVWADQSGQLLESEDVRDALAVFIVDQAYSSADVEARLEESLPERLKPLAGPASSQLRGVAYQTASEALARPRVQELWRSTNRAVNAQLVALLEGDTERLQLSGDAVVLDLDQIVANVAGRIGAGDEATETVQERVEPIVILRSDQLSLAQDAVKALKALSFWPLILTLAFWAGAVYLARGRRREAVRMIAVSLILLGVVLLVVRRLGGAAVVDSLVQAESLKAAVADVWAVLTSLLAESAAAGILVGAIALVGTWLAGPTRRATAIRHWLAPTFRDRPALPHLVLALVLLLVLLWGPTGTPRRFISVVIVTILVFVGLELFRRQTVAEFPNAVPGEVNPLAWRPGRAAAEASSDVEAQPTAKLERLERLAALHERGALTDDEYDAEKTLVLST